MSEILKTPVKLYVTSCGTSKQMKMAIESLKRAEKWVNRNLPINPTQPDIDRLLDRYQEIQAANGE